MQLVSVAFTSKFYISLGFWRLLKNIEFLSKVLSSCRGPANANLYLIIVNHFSDNFELSLLSDSIIQNYCNFEKSAKLKAKRKLTFSHTT